MHRPNISLLLRSMIRCLSFSLVYLNQWTASRRLFIHIYIRSLVREHRRKTERNSTWFPSSFVSFPLFIFFFFSPPCSVGRNEKNFYFQAFHQITGGTVYYRFPANKRSWFKSPPQLLSSFFFFSPLVILVSRDKNVENYGGATKIADST